MAMKIKNLTVSQGETDRMFTCVMSKQVTDRDGEVVLLDGMDTANFNANPVVLFVHNSHSVPVGKALSVAKEGDELIGKCEFTVRPESHPAEEEWLPDTLAHMVKEKCLNAVSIGFMVKEIRPATDADIKAYGAGTRYVITKSELWELSVVPVPCNRDALIKMKGMKSAAIIEITEDAPSVVAKKHTVYIVKKKGVDTDEAARIAIVRVKGGLYV
jgi:HK97 family phage prohead protease